jgi:hypothetical protein
MYEEMTRTIQIGERSTLIDTYPNAGCSPGPPDASNTIGVPSRIMAPEINDHPTYTVGTAEKENMQEELKAFMDNMT